MSVYVDPLADHGWSLGPSSHLIADSVGELHEFAARIGMRRSWFQNRSGGTPHYDLTRRRRAAAVRAGAVELPRGEFVYRCKLLRASAREERP